LKIKMKTRMSSPKYQAAPDEIIDVDEIKGKELIKGGFAVPVTKEPPKIEQAVANRGNKK